MLNFLRQKHLALHQRILEAYSKKRLQAHAELWQKLGAVISPSTGCSYADYWTLYAYVKKYKPKEILELGSGISTVVLCQAVRENGIGHVTSLEEDEFYRNKTEEIIPSDLRSNLDLVHSPAVIRQYGIFNGTSYSEIPERPYDFVFVDGPHYDQLTSFDADLLTIISKSETPVSAIIDYRIETSFIYYLLLGKKFYFNYTQRLGFIDRATKHDLVPFREVAKEHLRQRHFRPITRL